MCPTCLSSELDHRPFGSAPIWEAFAVWGIQIHHAPVQTNQL